MGEKRIGIGIVGAGVVGGGVVKVLRGRESYFGEELGLPLRLVRVADKDTGRFASLPTGDAALSGSADDVLGDPAVDIAVELIGGTGFAREFVLSALRAGKQVVTANKALLATHGPDIFKEAERNGVSVYFEASVGGGMPVIKTIREAMVGNHVSSVRAIINGTCNYILTRMTCEGLSFGEALKDAQARGYAEANPELDVGGGDSGHKVAIMASLLYGGHVPFGRVAVEGIKDIAPEDIESAAGLGYVVKLLGVIRRDDPASPIEARVHPAMLRKDHILASVSDAFNAVLLRGDAVGDILLYGKGAGELPTASAVVGDIVDAARDIAGGTPQRIPMGYYGSAEPLPIRGIEELESRYYLRFSVLDVPGVLAAVASVFARHSISIASVVQRDSVEGESVTVIFVTHRAAERSLRSALAEIEAMDFIRARTVVVRIED